MKRAPEWFKDLSAFIASTRNVPYAVGTNDCVHWTARAIQAMTGNVPAGFVDLCTYTDEAEMLALKDKMGGLRNAVSTVLGAQPLPGNHARIGDVVYFHPAPDVETVGICVGAEFVCVGDEALNFFKLRKAEACWRVG
ncbi:MAG: hypothetical protein KGL39_28535 [Patescibacteria group bacterium]|nr:hypothetical protein [Patescibacteria group bacterium]